MKLRTIFGGNKSASDIRKQIDNFELHTNIMITRLPKSTFDSIQWDTDKIVMRNAEKAYNVRGIHSLSYCISSQTAFIYRNPRKSELSVAITSAGLADRHVVDEAGLTVLLSGYTPVYFNDIGVDNIHKTLAAVSEISKSHAIVSVQGFEGALPVILAGLVDLPIISVPTSTGYGVSSDGMAALNTSLTSCTSGISAVNIDNGFGGGAQSVRVLLQIEKFKNEVTE